METKEITTKSGTKVQISIHPNQIRADFTHPKAGKVSFSVSSYGIHQGQAGMIGNWYVKGKNNTVVLTCDEAIWIEIRETQKRVRREAELEEARKQAGRLAAAKAACPAGCVVATRLWANGDLCSAEYETEDGVKVLASDLLENHDGFYWLPAELVEEKRTIDRKAWQELEGRTTAQREKEEAIFAEAKETGKPVVLRKTSAPCNDPHEECSLDMVTVYAMPDGSTKTERHHTW